MPDLPAVRAREIIAVIEKQGWRLKRTKGSHRIYDHSNRPGVVVVPVHPGDVGKSLVKKIISDAGMTVEDFIALL